MAIGDKMKNVSCLDIQSLIANNIDTTNIIEDISKMMLKEYPNFYEWFNNKVLPELANNTRNIVFLQRNNKIIGFLIIKNTPKEKKISNIYIKYSLFYEQYWNCLVDKAIDILEDDYPVIIISAKEIKKCVYLINDRHWYLTDRSKNNDYILNRYHEIENIRKTLIKKRKA